MSLRTRTIAVDPDAPEPAALAEAAAIVRRGGLVAFATETVYGLGADATNPEAVARIFEAKGRPAFNPLIVHSDRVVSARACVAKWPADADVLERSFWPGPLTLVLTRAEIIPDIVTAGGDTVGVRIPNHTVARRLIELAGRPIAAPSANRSTGISPSRAEHVLKDLDGKIDLVLDSGPSGGIESTVLDLTARPPRVLRPGTITIAQLSEALGIEVLGPSAGTDDSTAPSSPGQLAVHYAPRTPAFRVDRARFQGLPGAGRWGLIAIGPPVVVPRVHAPSRHLSFEEPKQAEAGLYEALHALDLGGFDFLIVVPPPDEPRWLAIRDRIQRATRPWPEPDV